MPKEFIVAIELGSSKITGVAGRKNLDGSISILAVVKEDSTSCIRKGVVYNIDKTVLALTNIVKKLETTLKSKIAYVYVGVGGQSIRSMKNVIVKELQAESVVTQDMINELMDANRNMSYPEQEILDEGREEHNLGQVVHHLLKNAHTLCRDGAHRLGYRLVHLVQQAGENPRHGGGIVECRTPAKRAARCRRQSP